MLPKLFAHIRKFVDGAYGQSAESEAQVKAVLGKRKAEIFRKTISRLRPLQRERSQQDRLAASWAFHDGERSKHSPEEGRHFAEYLRRR